MKRGNLMSRHREEMRNKLQNKVSHYRNPPPGAQEGTSEWTLERRAMSGGGRHVCKQVSALDELSLCLGTRDFTHAECNPSQTEELGAMRVGLCTALVQSRRERGGPREGLLPGTPAERAALGLPEAAILGG